MFCTHKEYQKPLRFTHGLSPPQWPMHLAFIKQLLFCKHAMMLTHRAGFHHDGGCQTITTRRLRLPVRTRSSPDLPVLWCVRSPVPRAASTELLRQEDLSVVYPSLPRREAVLPVLRPSDKIAAVGQRTTL